MKLNELRNLVKEVIKEQQEGDFTQHTNRSVVSFYKVMLRQPPSRHQALADLYDIMVINKKAEAQDYAEEMGFSRGLVSFHQKGFKDTKGDPLTDLPTGTQLLAAAQEAAQVRKDAEAAAQAERNKIKVRDRGSFSKGRNYNIDATTEEEARAEHARDFGQFPGPSTLYLDPEGNYFVNADYGNLGT
jgi:hypothetical protein